MLPPYPYVNYNGDGFRAFPLPPNSFVTENWLVERVGRLTIHAEQTIGGQSLPVGNIFFRLQGNGVDQTPGHRAERPGVGRPGRRDVHRRRPARIPATRYHRERRLRAPSLSPMKPLSTRNFL
jgi:hypothetical protein